MNKISKSPKETGDIAKAFLAKLKPEKNRATIVALYGDLGAGKTTFTQTIGKEMKIKSKVKSPTFVIMKKYAISKEAALQKFSGGQDEASGRWRKLLQGNPFKFLFHIDAYRLKDEHELPHLGWNEIISNKEHLVFIEWPENIIKGMPKKHHQIHISHTKEGHRSFKIKKS